jgi:hypothetical protein
MRCIPLEGAVYHWGEENREERIVIGDSLLGLLDSIG